MIPGIETHEDGRYYAMGQDVYRAPMRHTSTDDGKTTLVMGFHVCTTTPYVPRCAEVVAHVLTHEEKLRGALDAAIIRLRSTTDDVAADRGNKVIADKLQAVLDAASKLPDGTDI